MWNIHDALARQWEKRREKCSVSEAGSIRTNAANGLYNTVNDGNAATTTAKRTQKIDKQENNQLVIQLMSLIIVLIWYFYFPFHCPLLLGNSHTKQFIFAFIGLEDYTGCKTEKNCVFAVEKKLHCGLTWKACFEEISICVLRGEYHTLCPLFTADKFF